MCTPEESPHPIGWKKDIVDVSNNDINKEGAQRKEAPQRNRSRSKDRSDKCKRPKNNSSSSSSSSTGSSSSASSQDRDRKKLEKIERKKAKKEAKREAKKIRKEQKRSEKHERKEMKKKEKHLKKMKKQEKRDKKNQDNNGANIAECGPPINLMDNKARAPETKEEWEARQSQIRRVQDPETGRTRLVKGDGEILEEFVSKDRHKEINKQATAEDGAFFQSRTVGWVPNNN